MSIQRIGIIGAGQMGNGIGHVAAQAGYQVILQDIAPEALQKAVATIEKNMAREVKKEKLTEEAKTKAMSLISTTTELAEVAKADLVVEAIVEKFEVKAAIYQELAKHMGPQGILASNTSSISITKLGSAAPDASRFLGMHFFNPVPMMELVELIKGMATSDATYAAVQEVTAKMGKVAVDATDSPGFVVNRILCPMINEAIVALHEGAAGVEAIDTAMKLGARHPMGPLTLADYIGLDTMLAVMQVLHRELGEDKYRPSPLLVKYVEAGWLGVKTGKGFYDYAGDEPVPTR